MDFLLTSIGAVILLGGIFAAPDWVNKLIDNHRVIKLRELDVRELEAKVALNKPALNK